MEVRDIIIMKKTLIHKMKETFQDLNQMKPEQMEDLMKETLKVFYEMDEIAKSKDPKKQEEALEYAHQIKEVLEEQVEQLWKTTGLNPEKLTELMEQEGIQGSGEMKKLLDTFEKDLQTFKKAVPQKSKIKPQPLVG